MLTLIGIAIVVVGFVLRINPLLVVTIAGLATGIAGGLSLLEVIAAFGKAFITSRYVAIVWLVLPVIGLLEHAGLKERARAVVAGLRAATTSRVLLVYFAIRHDIILGPHDHGVPAWALVGILLLLFVGASVIASVAIPDRKTSNPRSMRTIEKRRIIEPEPEPTRRNPPAKLPPIRE